MSERLDHLSILHDDCHGHMSAVDSVKMMSHMSAKCDLPIPSTQIQSEVQDLLLMAGPRSLEKSYRLDSENAQLVPRPSRDASTPPGRPSWLKRLGTYLLSLY